MNLIFMVANATLNLACKLHADLLVPRELGLNGALDKFIVKGGLRLKGENAPCSVFVERTWVSCCPSVICHAPWLRKEPDWHAFSDGSLCYVYAPEWRDIMLRLAEQDGFFAAAEAAHLWIVRNVTWLLNKHLLAYQLGITAWPKEWAYWPHNAAEARELYIRLRRET